MVDNDIGAQAPTSVRSIREAEAKFNLAAAKARRAPRRRPRLAAQDGAGTHGSLDPGHDGRHYGHLFPSQDDAEVLAAGERAPMGACGLPFRKGLALSAPS